VNTGQREIVRKKEGEKKGGVRGSVHWGCYYDTDMTKRLILNAATLTAASQTLLFNNW
jgi:hypothetical protein